ncbi:MAG: ABC transporter permease [Thermodesulfovibrionales bacterium]|nr:ABC transporter permease [Thermodesulfovibrionales bacterium]
MKSKEGKISIFILLLVVSVSFSSSLIGFDNYNEIDLDIITTPPSLQHPFGTDMKGRDVFLRVLHGIRISIVISILSVIISSLIGFIIGIISGYIGGKVDLFLMTIVDFILSFPTLLFVIAISILFPPGMLSVIIALSAIGWSSFARITRGITLSVKQMPFVEASVCTGCSHTRILLRHIAPQCLSTIFILMGIKLGGFVLAEATLGFLGLGIQPPEPSLGAMVSSGRHYLLTAPWISVFPGLVIFVIVFCFNTIGESLRKVYDIRD